MLQTTIPSSADLSSLNEFLIRYLNVDKLIVDGDWNVCLERIDKKGGARWVQSAYRDEINSMMEDLGLREILGRKSHLL